MSFKIHTNTRKGFNTTAFIPAIHPHCLCAGSWEQQQQTMYVFTPVHWVGLLGINQGHLRPWRGDSLSSTLEPMLQSFVAWKNTSWAFIQKPKAKRPKRTQRHRKPASYTTGSYDEFCTDDVINQTELSVCSRFCSKDSLHIIFQ